MIVPAKRGFWQLLLTLQGSVLPRVLPQILLVALLSGVAWLIQSSGTFEKGELN